MENDPIRVEMNQPAYDKPLRATSGFMYPIPFGWGFRAGNIRSDHINGMIVVGVSGLWEKVWWRFYKRIGNAS